MTSSSTSKQNQSVCVQISFMITQHVKHKTSALITAAHPPTEAPPPPPPCGAGAQRGGSVIELYILRLFPAAWGNSQDAVFFSDTSFPRRLWWVACFGSVAKMIKYLLLEDAMAWSTMRRHYAKKHSEVELQLMLNICTSCIQRLCPIQPDFTVEATACTQSQRTAGKRRRKAEDQRRNENQFCSDGWSWSIPRWSVLSYVRLHDATESDAYGLFFEGRTCSVATKQVLA